MGGLPFLKHRTMSKYFKSKQKPMIILFACDVNRPRGLSCKDAIGGLLNVYFINYGDAAFGATVYDALTEQVTGVTLKDGTPGTPDAYKYELHLGNDLTQNINSSAENGTLFFNQVLSLTLKKMTQEDNVEIRNIAAGRPYVIVEDQMENLWLVGRINGASVTGGTAVTGNAFGDLNGYTLTIEGNERTLANEYTGDLATDFNVISDNGAVVTGVTNGSPLAGAAAATGQVDSVVTYDDIPGSGELTYLSDDEAIATVDFAGLVTFVAIGSATIVATSVENPSFSGTTSVTVS
jgi:hypothetical protein